ncbi:3555_t:CDS:1 [Funneliformis geosporum]|uniref:3943_t:CDS:1 n=1 Tax=Funneliformis geosporum TaxID=1117311 RepID=A0A9W4WM73_9GLOM|nr:3555_t:CDS:1 [Funneliformis geosporum]CAI2172416.1 3943_t:CDS:1 [Funneliformis geosporum]
MPSKSIIIPEILEIIFSYLYYPVFYPKFLLSCALVSRSWSNLALPILWNKPFVYDRRGNNHVKQIQQFRTCLSFLPNQFLKQVGLEQYVNKSLKINYNYLSFIKELCHLKLYEACLNFCKDKINDDQIMCRSNHPSKAILQTKILPILTQLYHLIILKYDARIKYFEFSIPFKESCLCDYIPVNYFIFSHHVVSKYFFTSLRSFKCNGRYNFPYEKLFKEVMKHSKNIKHITIENFELVEGNLESLKDLIISQKKLQNIELEFLIKRDFSELFDALNENQNLLRVRISFCSFKKALPIKILSSCKNLKELSIESSEIGYEECHKDFNPFESLKSFKIVKSKLPKEIFDYIFSPNSNLEQIIIKEMDLLNNYPNIIPSICLNCHQLKILKMGFTEKTFEKLLEILKYCINLQELIIYDELCEIEDMYTFNLTDINHLSTGEVFKRLGKLISRNLKKLHFSSFYHCFEYDFKEFLISCKINGCLEYLSINVCGDKSKILRMLENYSKGINKGLIIKQWDTRNYDGNNERFNQIIIVKFN